MSIRFEQFNVKANSVHNNKYDYSLFVYVSAKTPGIIICPHHGQFSQKPDHHTRKGAIGCPTCVNNNKLEVLSRVEKTGSTKTPKQEYLRRLTDKYGDKFEYNLSNYLSLTSGTVDVVCKVHGVTTYNPMAPLISRFGCRHCGEKVVLYQK